MTNYERIKRMSVEEIAEWLDAHTTKCDICVYDEQCRCLETCFFGIKKWLERESDDEQEIMLHIPGKQSGICYR